MDGSVLSTDMDLRMLASCAGAERVRPDLERIAAAAGLVVTEAVRRENGSTAILKHG